jgi:cytochrome c oxidase cbb3-type subunit I/II
MASAAALANESPAKESLETKTIVYNDDVVRKFVIASVIFGLVAFLAGATAALQLAWHPANLPPWFNFGRLRPLHTNAAIFAFVGNMMFAGVYYSTQRLLKARLASDLLSKIHFWGWQLIIVAAAVTLPLGITTSKEYAELEWPIDIAITVIWVVFAINFFATLWKRNEKHLYVAIWFYIATIVTVAILHIFNSLEVPLTLTKSYSIYAGTKDALVQWWYGHNAVAFFLTTPILGIMYYFVPKAAKRPVYSYRLSIVHFWALVFIYIWAGPHHLLNTALPNWAQSLGMVFSIALIAPSWGGMINGLLTLRGGWQDVRNDPVLKFFAAGITFYGMSTFEGPMLSIKSVSALAHYTDWIIGHVHSGALGWNGFMAAGMFYWMVPRLYGTKLYSKKAADLHFYIGTIGILLYMVSMWVAGITQGMMLRAHTADGSLVYGTFVETLVAIRPMYWMRLIGGTAYLIGMLMMAWNLTKTALSGKAVDGVVDVVVVKDEEDDAESKEPWTKLVFSPPVLLSAIVMAIFGSVAFAGQIAGGALLLFGSIVAVLGVFFVILAGKRKDGKPKWHAILEGRAAIFTALTLVAVLIGGAAEIIPLLLVTPAQSSADMPKPYRALELEGRDIYIREGCYVCHSQMIRPFVWEKQRFGEPSTMADSMWDHPFQWGSKRTGPDLARVGLRIPDASWHWKHMINPRFATQESNMPPYPHLEKAKVDFGLTQAKVRIMRSLGVPYDQAAVEGAVSDAKAQAADIVGSLKAQQIAADPDSELVALISFLQRLGKNPSALGPAESKPISAAETAPTHAVVDTNVAPTAATR